MTWVPRRSVNTRPASFSTLKCPERVGLLNLKWLAISPAVRSPSRRRARMSRRTGLERAAKTSIADSSDNTEVASTHRHRKRAAPRGAALQFHAGRSRRSSREDLLQLDGAAGFLDLLLDLLGLGLGDAFLDRLRRALDQRLGFAEAQLGDRADLLDHVDLLATVAGKDHVELGLLFSSRSGGAATGGRRSGNSRGGRNAPLLFQRLREVGGFENGQRRKLVNQRIDVCHDKSPKKFNRFSRKGSCLCGFPGGIGAKDSGQLRARLVDRA